MQIKKVTPIQVVDTIEDLLPHWTDRMGFACVASVPQGDHLGFVILASGEATVMLQTRESLRADMVGAVGETFCARDSLLYVDVVSIEEVQAGLGDLEVLVPLRTTFYGAREIWVRDPSGAIIGFAEHKES